MLLSSIPSQDHLWHFESLRVPETGAMITQFAEICCSRSLELELQHVQLG